MIVAIDVDDVCADLLTAWLGRYNQDYDDTLTRADITRWELDQCVKPECGRKIFDILKEHDLYDDVVPIADAQQGVEALRRLGHRVLFVTSCGYDHATISASAGAKLLWLQRHGFLPTDHTASKQYIVAGDKSLIKADVLIDDRPLNIDTFPGRGVLFTQPHNREHKLFGVDTRVLNWHEAVRAVADRMPQPVIEWIEQSIPLRRNPATGAIERMQPDLFENSYGEGK